MLNAGMSMFASADCLKNCVSLYDELCEMMNMMNAGNVFVLLPLYD